MKWTKPGALPIVLHAQQRALQNILRRTDSGYPEDFNNRVWMPGKSQEEK